MPDFVAFLKAFTPALPQDDGKVSPVHFLNTFWIAIVILIARVIVQRSIMPWLKKSLKKGGKPGQVFENLWIVGWSVGTEVLAVYVTLYLNGECKPWNTGPCLTAWPNHPVHVLQKWYMIIMFQFYMHEMIGAVVGAVRMKGDMVIHHVATMGLISTAYSLNLNRYGIMWQALFDTSNPFLHAAKGMHATAEPKLDGIKWFFFHCFALVFFVCRVATAPASILFPAFTRSWAVLPEEWAFFLIILMIIVCGMQWVWFSKIVMMAMGKGEKEEEEEGEEAAAADKKDK